MYPTSLSSAAANAAPATSTSCAATTRLSDVDSCAIRPVAVATSSKSCACQPSNVAALASDSAIGPPPTTTNCGTDQNTETTVSSTTCAALARDSNSCAAASPAAPIVAASNRAEPTTSSPCTRVTRHTGRRASNCDHRSP